MSSDILVKIIIGICGFANLFLAFYVYFDNSKEKINKYFFYFGIGTSLWCFTNFISLMTKNLFWLRATYAIVCFLVLAGVYFAYAISNKKINKVLGTFLLVISVFFFFINLFTPLLVQKIVSFTNFGIEIISGSAMYYWEEYFLLMIVIIIYVPLKNMLNVDEQRKKQISYFLTGEAIFAFWGIFVAIVLPYFGINSLINLDSPSTLFMLGFTSYAIIKYGLFTVDIKQISENIVNTMSDFVVAVDQKMKIVFVNKAVTSISGLSKIALINQPLEILIDDSSLLKNYNDLSEKLPIDNYKTKLITKDKKIISITANISEIKDNLNNNGIIMVFRDTTQIDDLINNLEVKNIELERINKLMVGREIKMIELKKIIEEQKEELQKLS